LLIPALAACTTSKISKTEIVTPTSTTGSPSTTTSSTSAAPPTTSTTIPISGNVTVSSTNLAVGQSITIAGRGCPRGSYVEPHIIPDPLPAIFKQAGYEAAEWLLYDKNLKTGDVNVGANGIWTITAAIPMIPPGAAKITGWCRQSGNGNIEFDYPGVVVQVASPFGMQVLHGPFTSPGTSISVKTTGGGCPSSASTAGLSLYSETGSDVADGESSSVSGWQWSLLVPKALGAGEYQLEADCVEGYAVWGTYAPLKLTVGKLAP